MQIVVMLMLILAVSAGVGAGLNQKAQPHQDSAQAMAAQMALYHFAAVRRCSASPTACSTGTVSGVMAGAPSGTTTSAGGIDPSGWYENAFVSAYDASSRMVVTTWQPGNSRLGQSGLRLGGLIGGALVAQSEESRWAGTYNRSAQTISATRTYSYGSQSGTAAAVSVPSSFGGLNLTDGAPIMATPAY